MAAARSEAAVKEFLMRIIPNQGICDPHMHVYNGKVYLFASHDRCPNNEIYRMDDWKVFSSNDLLNWK